MYTQRDSIGLEWGYGYVFNTLIWIAPFGLDDFYALVTKADGWYDVMK